MNFQDLIGKTISGAQRMLREDYDDTGFLRLKFTDGTTAYVIGDYGGYSGSSFDEYPTCVYLQSQEELDADGIHLCEEEKP